VRSRPVAFTMSDDPGPSRRPWRVSYDSSVTDKLICVACTFRDGRGRAFQGFMYWCEPGDELISIGQPVLWAGDTRVTFWNGLGEPGRDHAAAVRALFDRAAWPIRFESVGFRGRRGARGELLGLYWLDGDAQRCLRFV
jgi:hypothetical protein